MSLAILPYSHMAWPTDWTVIFGRDGPLVLELGFGNGAHLVELGQRYPSSNILGIEISLPSLRRGLKKINDARLSNVRILQGDSRSALWLLFRPASISMVTINFPDPWPKAGHHHRRLINDRFLDLLASRVWPEAELNIATDHKGYALAIEDCLNRSPYFESRTGRPFESDVADRRRTKYEQIALSEGIVPRYFLWKRNEQIATDQFPIPEDKAMPHVVLLSELNLDEFGRRFEPFHAQSEDVHIKFLNIYRSVDGRQLLVEVYVSEEPYHQRVGLSVRQRHDGDLVVSMQEIGFPRPTEGIHLAIQHLVEWLRALDPTLKIINSTLTKGSDGSILE